ncbi:hypothetical protein JCM8208_001384 [Rhodotorula glutinis]
MSQHGKQLPSGVGLAISFLEGEYVKHNGHSSEAYTHVNKWVWDVEGLLKEHTDGWTAAQWDAVQRELQTVKNSIAQGGQLAPLPDLRSPGSHHVVPILCALENSAAATRRLEAALHSGLGEDHYDRSLSKRGAANHEQYGSRASRRY